MKKGLRIILSSPNLWKIDRDELHAWTLSSLLRRIKYVGKLKPVLIPTWLCSEVGLTSYDVVACFAPFAYLAFESHALTNPRASHTSLVPPEAHSTSTGDSLSDFGDDLDWTSAHGPRGPPLKSKQGGMGLAAPSDGTADASNMSKYAGRWLGEPDAILPMSHAFLT